MGRKVENTIPSLLCFLHLLGYVWGDGGNHSSDTTLFRSRSEIGTIIPEVYSEALAQPLFYETVAIAIFQFSRNTGTSSEFRFSDYGTRCPSERAEPKNPSWFHECYLMHHLEGALKHLNSDFEQYSVSLLPSLISSVRQKTAYEKLEDFCNEIQPHFSGSWKTSEELETYLEALNDCNNQKKTVYTELSIQKYNYSIPPYYKKLNESYFTHLHKPMMSHVAYVNHGYSQSTLYQLFTLAGQGLLLSQSYAERGRWIQAMQDCRNGHLPLSLINHRKLKTTLNRVMNNPSFRANNYTLSVPIEELDKYYQFPLTDCTQAPESYVVRLLIPVMNKYPAEHFQLVRLQPISFQYDAHICQVKLPVGKIYLHHKTRGKAYSTNCRSNQLCKISEETLLALERNEPCASSLLSGNADEIGASCDYDCWLKENLTIPSVVPLSSSKFAVTGDSHKLQVSCGNKTFQVKPTSRGTTLVSLRCNCILTLPGSQVVYGGTVCKHNLTESEMVQEIAIIYPAIPLTLAVASEMESSESQQSALHFYNITKILNKEKFESLVKASLQRRRTQEIVWMDMYQEEKLKVDCVSRGLFWSLTTFFVAVISALGLCLVYFVRQVNKLVNSYSLDNGETKMTAGINDLITRNQHLMDTAVLYRVGEDRATTCE